MVHSRPYSIYYLPYETDIYIICIYAFLEQITVGSSSTALSCNGRICKQNGNVAMVHALVYVSFT